MPVRLLISDLDNTLYDWVGSFVAALDGMIEVAARDLGVGEERLRHELREVHRRYQSTEHPFALLETGAVRQRLPRLDRAERRARLASAFERFDRIRDRTLALYPEVAETLETLQRAGVILVACTDAHEPSALHRVKRLGLDRYFAHLYAPPGRGLPHPDPSRLRAPRHPFESRVRRLATSERKPRPSVLLRICAEMGTDPREAVYVGDSLARDVAMAQAARLNAAWARYGTRYAPSRWASLATVTHWEESATRQERQEPAGDLVSLDSFGELLRHYEFARF